jgi:hypothetical protein
MPIDRGGKQEALVLCVIATFISARTGNTAAWTLLGFKKLLRMYCTYLLQTYSRADRRDWIFACEFFFSKSYVIVVTRSSLQAWLTSYSSVLSNEITNMCLGQRSSRQQSRSDAALVRVIIGCVFVKVVIELKTYHIYEAVL